MGNAALPHEPPLACVQEREQRLKELRHADDMAAQQHAQQVRREGGEVAWGGLDALSLAWPGRCHTATTVLARGVQVQLAQQRAHAEAARRAEAERAAAEAAAAARAAEDARLRQQQQQQQLEQEQQRQQVEA